MKKITVMAFSILLVSACQTEKTATKPEEPKPSDESDKTLFRHDQYTDCTIDQKARVAQAGFTSTSIEALIAFLLASQVDEKTLPVCTKRNTN